MRRRSDSRTMLLSVIIRLAEINGEIATLVIVVALQLD